ncbi:MAG: Crp/Fnr family transcriptional regulator [Chitinophagaceae bacterium]|jgi:CRP-like cAMP-binding protein|nr:Crp/Fnr family transcriptional regulator [Chitinophagaceae bacterium]
MHPLQALIKKFSPINSNEWELLYEKCTEVTIHKGDFFIKQGRVETRIGFIITGSFRQFYINPSGEELSTYFFFEHNLVSSYISCITGKTSLISIQAIEESTLLVFDYTHLASLFKDYPNWQLFGRKIAEYLLAGIEERMVGLLADNPEERYRKLLASPDKQKILERIPQQYIANYLGITPISLSRIRNRINK